MDTAAAVELLSRWIEALVAQAPVPGGSVVVVDAAGTVAEFCFGLANVEGALPVTAAHRFEIGSISKVFTSLVVNDLVDDGLLDLDHPVVHHLPWLYLGPGTEQVTARHLLTHTAGLVLGADGIPDDLAQLWGLRELVRSGPPGSRFHYSNVGFILLGRLVSAVTGLPYPEVLRSRLFEPMGIHEASPRVTHADRGQMATGYWPARDDQPWAPGDQMAPSTWFEVAAADGNVAANSRELGQLLRLLLGDGGLDGTRVVSAAALRRMSESLAPTGEPVVVWGKSPGAQSSRYGLGVNLEEVDAHVCLTHGGGMVGYASFILADRTAGLGVGVLTNGNGDCPAAQLIARVVHRLFLAVSSGGAVPELPDPGAALPARSLPSSALGRFQGRIDDVPLRIEITAGRAGETVLVVQDGPPGVTGVLYRTWGPRYVTDHPGLRRFHLSIDPTSGGWQYGPFLLTRSGAPADPLTLDARLSCHLGHYRSYSPWYPSFRVVARGERLFLIAPGGVEAPDEDTELVELSAGVFRLGADAWLPERLVAGPMVDGRTISMARDGADYSRTFTD